MAMNDSLKCTQCKKRFQGMVKLLPCGSSICSKCEALLIISESHFECLVCSVHHEMPAGGLPLNRAIMELNEIESAMEAEILESFQADLKELHTLKHQFKANVKGSSTMVKQYCNDLRSQIKTSEKKAIEHLKQLSTNLIKQVDEFEYGLETLAKPAADDAEENEENEVRQAIRRWDQLITDCDAFHVKWSKDMTSLPKKQTRDTAKRYIEAINVSSRNIKRVMFRDRYLKLVINEQFYKAKDCLGRLFAFDSANERIGYYDTNIVLSGHQSKILSLALINDTKLVSCGCEDRTIILWDLERHSLMYSFTGHTDEINCLVVLPDGTVASASEDTTVMMWNVLQGKYLTTLQIHRGPVRALASMSQDRLATGSSDGNVKIFDLVSKKVKVRINHGSSDVFSLAELPENRLAGSTAKGSVLIWDAGTGVAFQRLDGHLDCVWTILRLNDKTLVSAGLDGKVLVWDLETLTSRSLRKHVDSVTSLVALDNERFASGSADDTVIIWNSRSGEALQQLRGHTKSVWSLAALPNGKLLTGSADHTIKIWSCPSA